MAAFLEVNPVTTCILLYGDYPQLACRCLESVLQWIPLAGSSFRIGLNVVSAAVRDYVGEVGTKVASAGGQAVIYESLVNAYKYPMMRRLFYDPDYPVRTPFVLWSDDDSYITGGPGWWSKVLRSMDATEMIGQRWFLPMQGNQWEWIKRQKWFNPAVGKPRLFKGRHSYCYCQGAWWVIRSKVLFEHDWPPLDLRHCGGDSMLGELFRHQGLRIRWFENGVRINANHKGEHSKAARRGLSEPVIGKHYHGVIEEANHAFSVTRTVY